VTDEEGARAWLSAFSAGFGLPGEAAAHLLAAMVSRGFDPADPIEHFVLRDGGSPRASGTLVRGPDGLGGVFNLAVHPDARRRRAGPGMPDASVGYTDGARVLRALAAAPGPAGEAVYDRFSAGVDLQDGPGEPRLIGLTHAAHGAVRAWVDGAPVAAGRADYGGSRGWSILGGSLEGPYWGPYSRFGGTLGAVLVTDAPLDDADVARLHAWARGRFGVGG